MVLGIQFQRGSEIFRSAERRADGANGTVRFSNHSAVPYGPQGAHFYLRPGGSLKKNQRFSCFDLNKCVRKIVALK